jgi:hypothetical protein
MSFGRRRAPEYVLSVGAYTTVFAPGREFSVPEPVSSGSPHPEAAAIATNMIDAARHSIRSGGLPGCPLHGHAVGSRSAGASTLGRERGATG